MIYLASQSVRRRGILRSVKIRFRVIPSRYQERMRRGMTAAALALRHAEGKARHARMPRGARWLLAADTLVAKGRRIFGKPRSMGDAVSMLSALAGTHHFVVTALVLEDRKKKKRWCHVEKTKVIFKKLTRPEIEAYLRKVPPFDKAGSYAIQRGPKLVKKIEGSYSNVVGLPREALRRMLRQASCDLTSSRPSRKERGR